MNQPTYLRHARLRMQERGISEYDVAAVLDDYLITAQPGNRAKIASMRYGYDPEVNALYIHLREMPYAFGENLDNPRRIDYAADRRPIGIELLNVHRGVKLEHLPAQHEVSRILDECQLKVLA